MIATRTFWHKTSLLRTYPSRVPYSCLVAAGMLNVEDKLDAEGRIDVGGALLADVGDYHRVDDADTIAVEGMLAAEDTMAVEPGVGTKV